MEQNTDQVKKQRGRPKGSKNKPKPTEIVSTPVSAPVASGEE